MTRDRSLGALAVVAAASIWGTLGLFAKFIYAQGVSFASLVAGAYDPANLVHLRARAPRSG